MPRTVSAPELALLAGALYQVHLKVEIEDPDGLFRDYTNQASTNWIDGVVIDHDIDQPVSQCTVTLRRDSGDGSLSLSPLRTDSTLNRDAGSSYAPAVDVGRLMKVWTAVTAIGGTPGGSDWKLMHQGEIDTLDASKNPMTCVARDAGGIVVDTWYGGEIVRDYSEAPTSLDVVIQEFITLAGFSPTITLYVPADPDWLVTSFKADAESVMDALQRLAQVIGWDLRYRYDNGTDTFRFTFSDPNRAKTTPDITLDANQIIEVSTLKIDRTNVRNSISVYAGPAEARFLAGSASDATSMSRYGVRPLIIQESSDSAINTLEEGQAEADIILSDLKDPKADHAVLMHYFWPVDLHDLLRASANAIHYDTNQDLAVVNIKHTITPKSARTTILTRGAPAGAYRQWIMRSRRSDIPPSADSDPAKSLSNVKWTDSADGTQRTFTWERGDRVTEVFVYDTLEQAPPQSDPWPASGQVPTTILTDGTNSYTVAKPPAGFQRYVQFEPRFGATFESGPVKRFVVDPAPSALTAKITSVVTNGTADLTIVVAGAVSDWPVTVEVYEGAAETLIATTSVSANTTLTKLSTGMSALGSRALPLRELLGWRVRLTNVAGQPAYAFASADRDALPNGSVTLVDYRATPKWLCSYDDDTDEIKVTFSNGAIKSLTQANGGLSAGGGVATVTIGDSVTSGSPESAFVVDETRSGYKIEYKGGNQYVTMFGGANSTLHGQPSNPPTLKTRAVSSTNGDAADVYALVGTSVSEQVRVFFRDAEDASAPVYGLCVSNVNNAARYVNNGDEVGPSDYFYSGTGSPAQKLSAIARTRDAVTRVYLQGVGKDSGVASAWIPVELSLKDIPFLESMSVVWDSATSNLRVRVKGGAKCQSVFIEVSTSSNFASPSTDTHALNPGDDYTYTKALSSGDMGKTWYARATPYNAVSLGGLAGEAMLAETMVSQFSLVIKAVVVSGSISTTGFQVDVTVSDPSNTPATMTLSHSEQGCTVARTSGGSDPLTTTGATFRYTVTRSTTVDAGSGGVNFNATATNRNDANVFVPADAQDQDAAPSLAVTTDASGNAIAVATGNNNTASWKWMASTSSMPADATVISSGTVANGRSATVTALTGLTLGQHYYVKFVPYTGSSASGSTGQSVSAEGDYQNKQQSKTLRLGHTFFVPQNSSSTIGRGVNAVTNGTKTSNAIYAALIIPLGVTLTGWRIRANRNGGTGSVTADLYRYDSSGGTTNLGTLTHSTTGYQTISGSLSETTSGDAYVALATIDTTACTNANDNSLLYVEYDYTSPSYVVTL